MMYSAENFPDSFTAADGTVYPIHTDFREWVRFESLIHDGDVPENLKLFMAVRLIFGDNVPEDINAAKDFVLWFYRGGNPLPEAEEKDEDSETEPYLESRRVYDLEYDSDYIFAAFLEQYHIDLSETSMHWWKFRALFRGLHDCKITEIMGYRGAEITDDMPDSRKCFLLDMQEMYELPVSLAERRRIEAAQKFLNT